jgi:fructokinase
MKEVIVGIGEALWDVLPEGKKLGGAPANFAYHVSQFGLNGCAVSAIGQDKLGDEIIEQLDARGLYHHIDVVPYPTGTVQVEIDQAGIPQYDIKENVAWDNIPYTASLEAIAQNTKAVCFIEAIPAENDPLIVFDINLRQGFYTKETICNSMKKCNILKINDEELVTISRIFGYPGIDLQDKCWILLGKYNLKMLILTCGVNGSYVFTPGNVSFYQTPKVKVADTVGAGDSFTASFIASIIKGKTIADAHRTAVDVSAYVCTQNGAMPVLPEEYTK